MLGQRIEQDGVTVYEDGTAYVNEGGTVWPLTESEKSLPLVERLSLIKSEWRNGENYRCTTCKTKLAKRDVAGWPLFAGVACLDCWNKHLEYAKTERRCTLCNQPMSFCCC